MDARSSQTVPAVLLVNMPFSSCELVPWFWACKHWSKTPDSFQILGKLDDLCELCTVEMMLMITLHKHSLLLQRSLTRIPLRAQSCNPVVPALRPGASTSALAVRQWTVPVLCRSRISGVWSALGPARGIPEPFRGPNWVAQWVEMAVQP